MGKIFLIPLLFLYSAQCLGQAADSLPPKKRIWPIAVAAVAIDAAVLTALGSVWYSEQPRGSFRFFNDMPEWRQMDKVGHMFSAYFLSNMGARILRNHSLETRKANLAGSLAGFLAVSQIEIFDGFSNEYGASIPDLAANATGALLAWSQMELWGEPRFRLKYSFHRTQYAAQRPEVLGRNIGEELIKDYNGQTYWLSADIDKFLPANAQFPKWLNLAVGYGAENMIFARDANSHYRQYYLSFDIDLSHLRSRNKWINFLLEGVNLIRLPAPALELNRNGIKFHWLYF